MVCLGLEPGAAGWKAQTNPLSYSGTPKFKICSIQYFNLRRSTWIKHIAVCKVLVWLELVPPLMNPDLNEVLIHLLILTFVKSM